MINRTQQKHMEMPSFVPKFSDPDLLRAVLHSDFSRHVFLGEKKAFWLFIKAVFFLKLEMFISPVRAVLRYGHGKRTTGITITLMSALMMIAFNTQDVLGYVATFFPFAAPVIPFIIPGEKIWAATFVDIRSQNLLFFWIAYLVFSVVHLLLIYYGDQDDNVSRRRGISVIHSLILSRLGVSEFFTQGVIEPLLVGGLGYGLWYYEIDFTFGILLMIAAFCLFFQESYDAVLKFAMRQ